MSREIDLAPTIHILASPALITKLKGTKTTGPEQLKFCMSRDLASAFNCVYITKSVKCKMPTLLCTVVCRGFSSNLIDIL